MSAQHAADRHEAEKPHEEIGHPAFRAADIGHLPKHGGKFVHDLLPEIGGVAEPKVLAHQRIGEIDALTHRLFHLGTMGLVERMQLSH